VTCESSVGTAISGILLWTKKPLAREPGLPRKYGKEELKGRNTSEVMNK
jgi:hypothetical protein